MIKVSPRMIPKKLVSIAILCLGLVLSLQASAENVEVFPGEWDFGDVIVGETASTAFQITSTGPTPLTLYEIEIDVLEGIFTVDYASFPGLPLSLPAGDSIDVTVGFTPIDLSAYVGVLNVISNATPPSNDLDRILRGRGVSAQVSEPLPLALICLGLLGIGLIRRRSRDASFTLNGH